MTETVCEWCGNALPCVNPYDEEEYDYDMYEIAHSDPDEIFGPHTFVRDEELWREAEKALRAQEHARVIGETGRVEETRDQYSRSVGYTILDWSL